MQNLIYYGINKRKIFILLSTKNTFKRSYHKTNITEMLRGFHKVPVTKRLKDLSKLEKQVTKKYKEFEESTGL